MVSLTNVRNYYCYFFLNHSPLTLAQKLFVILVPHLNDEEDNHEYSEIRDKIMKGLKMAIDKLVEETKLKDGELVIVNEKGEPVRVKARSLK